MIAHVLRFALLAAMTPLASSAFAAPFDVGSATVTGAYKIETMIEWTETTNKTTWVLPKVGLTIPLGSTFEVEFSGNYRFVDRGVVQEDGWGDAAIKVKWAILAEEADGWLPGIALEPKLSLPTGEESLGLGTGDTYLDVPVLFSRSFGTVGIGAKLAYGFDLGEGADGVSWGVLGTVKIASGLTLGAELVGDSPSTQLDLQRLRVNAGFKLKLNDTATLDGLIGRTVRTPQADETTSGKLVLEVKF